MAIKRSTDFLLAREMCLETSDCGGITYRYGAYELRKGSDLIDSGTGEVSYLLCSPGINFQFLLEKILTCLKMSSRNCTEGEIITLYVNHAHTEYKFRTLELRHDLTWYIVAILVASHKFVNYFNHETMQVVTAMNQP